MSQKTYMYDTQWTALINAINGGDTTAIATALGQIKTSVDSITTALGNLSTDVTQDSTQWNDLITAIGSGGGGGNVTADVDMDSTQWSNLLTAVNKGDTSALATALGLIKTSIDSINTSLSSLSADVTQDSTQWTNLVNAITNQSLTVDLSNITSDVVSNESAVTPADTVTEALDRLKSDLSKTVTFSKATGTTLSSICFGCSGSCLAGTIEIQCTASISVWTTIGTISTPPAFQIIVPAVRTGNGSFVGMVRIKTDGTVDLYSIQSLSNNALSFTFGYGI